MSLLSFTRLAALAFRDKILQSNSAQEEGTHADIHEDQINSASIDLTMGRTILVENPSIPRLDGTYPFPVVDFRAREPLSMTRHVLTDEGFVLPPGGFILAETDEIFALPLHISGEYKLKSSMARIGLEHLNAGWADAGWHGSVLTLEIKNMCQFHGIRIRPGDRIGQMVFFEHEAVPDDRSYAARGRYNNDKSVTPTKVAP